MTGPTQFGTHRVDHYGCADEKRESMKARVINGICWFVSMAGIGALLAWRG